MAPLGSKQFLPHSDLVPGRDVTHDVVQSRDVTHDVAPGRDVTHDVATSSSVVMLQRTPSVTLGCARERTTHAQTRISTHSAQLSQ